MRTVRSIFIFGIVAVAGLGAGLSQAHAREEEWDVKNDPAQILPSYEAKWGLLPKSGDVANLHSGNAWSNFRGGFAWRPRTMTQFPRSADILYVPYSREKIKELAKTPQGREELATLSPSEKFSLIQCDYSYAAVKSEREASAEAMEEVRGFILDQEKKPATARTPMDWDHIGNKFESAWSGYCDLASQTSALYAEPKASSFKNCDGVEIQLRPSDLKAFTMMAMRARPGVWSSRMLGRRCGEKGQPYKPDANANCVDCQVAAVNDQLQSKMIGTEQAEKLIASIRKHTAGDYYLREHACEDTNPGALQIVLANRVGKDRLPIVMDTHSGDPVWNHQIKSYVTKEIPGKARKPHPGAAPGTKREILVETTLTYINGLEIRDEDVQKQNQKLITQTKKLSYYLELDGEDRIVGGSWPAGSEFPDFLWMPNRPAPEALFAGQYEFLRSRIQPRIGSEK